MEKFDIIISTFKHLISDIENWQNKEWLKVAIVSNLHSMTGYNKGYIKQVVNMIYLSEDL